MTQAQQPEALRLAAICESKGMFSVADELNRMHARLLELEQGKCLHQIAELAAAPFMYAIADGYGNAFFEEQGCVSSEAKDLQPEVDSLNQNLDGEPPYAVVAVYTHPTQQGLAEAGMYYLQDARWSGMVGNCPSFWRPDGNGYTTNLDEAGRFTHEEAMAQHRSRSTDLPWLCSEVDKLRHPTVDVQHMPRSWDAQRAALAAQAGTQP